MTRQDKKIYKTKFEREILIMKDLHEPKTRAEICDIYGINDRTFRNYFNNTNPMVIGNIKFSHSIQEERHWNITMDGVNQNEKKGVENNLIYKSSVNPILLPLNMTEVYMLTNGLLDTFDKNSEIYKNYKYLVEKIYSQLSDYAIKKIGGNPHNLNKRETIEYESELKMYDKIHSSKFMYAEKTRDRVKIIFDDDSEVIGRVTRKGGELILTEEDSYNEKMIDNLGAIKEIIIL
ncbi:MAG: hypothetical protein PUF50_00545 [Erysipelotrichaceae bacterium]|nr:hypothetical protein [Erysipelotrichaceae bacterium]